MKKTHKQIVGKLFLDTQKENWHYAALEAMRISNKQFAEWMLDERIEISEHRNNCFIYKNNYYTTSQLHEIYLDQIEKQG